MALIDAILNLIGLVLWVSWRTPNSVSLATSAPLSIAGTLKRTEPQRLKRWHFLVTLAALVIFRAWLYWQLGSPVNWTPALRFGAISISFRSDIFLRMALFSLLGIVLTLALFYQWLLLFSIVNNRDAESSSIQRLIQAHLGRFDRLPLVIKWFLPLVLAFTAWIALDQLFVRWQILPQPKSHSVIVMTATVLAIGVYLSWKFAIAAILLLYLVNSYLYLGEHQFWSFISLTARNLISPLKKLPLRIGRVDFAPVVGLALVFLACELLERELTVLYMRFCI
jgi:uncharacterized protein YggT (Ycf19 family)